MHADSLLLNFINSSRQNISMKGMSLAIETIIVMILASIVLVALLFFFTGTFTPGADRATAEMTRATGCQDYMKVEPECKELGDFTGKAKLVEACKKLSYSGPDLVVIQSCCAMYCGKAATASTIAQTCTQAGGTCIPTSGWHLCTTGSLSGTCPSGEACCRNS
jgi:hypothetical protein